MEQHGITEPIDFIGHSYGSFVINYVVQTSPEIIRKIALIDPVALTIILPKSPYELMYRAPVQFADHLLNYFVRSDLNISHMLKRHFCWYNGAIPFHEIPPHIQTIIGIATDDILIDFDTLNYLLDTVSSTASDHSDRTETEPETRIPQFRKIIWDGLRHGDAIYNENSMKDIIHSLDSEWTPCTQNKPEHPDHTMG
jgi:pimeloyl-ACP methyl ester carboxylesterase